MLDRCRQLKPAINKFIRACRNSDRDDDGDVSNPGAGYDAMKDYLSDDDWDEVDAIINFLEVPQQLTKVVEGNNSKNGFGSLWQTIVDLQTLWDHYRDTVEGIRLHPANYSPYFKSAVGYGIEKLDTYWRKIVIDPVPSYYCVATALHPRLRLCWFKDHWRDFAPWHKKAEEDIKKAFEKYLAAEEIANEVETAEESRRIPPISHSHSRFARTMAVDTMLLTGNRNYRKQQKKHQLGCYYDDLQEDLATDSQAYQELLDDPWE
jgi:hypothetical protein